MKKIIKLILNILRGEQSIEKLKKRGLKVGRNFKNMGQSIIDPSHCWHIEIGDDVTFAPRVHILAHDASTKLFIGYTKIANTKIGNRVFIGAGSIVLPGVEIGDDVVIGAGSIVTKNIPSNSLAVGNPAKVLCDLDLYLKKQKDNMMSENTFGVEFSLRSKDFDVKKANKMIEVCRKYGKAFIE